MIKKIIICSLNILLCIMLCSCDNPSNIEYDKYEKVAENLYEVSCDEYDYDYLLSGDYGNIDFLNGACSGIKKGDYLGRNFDFVAKDAAEIIVKTTHKDNRYATIGMTGGLFWLTSEFMNNDLDSDAKSLLPILLLDGINEKGLAVEINCVNSMDVGGLTMETNPGKKEVAQLAVVRYLLDNAASADEAIEIMKNINIVNTRNVMGLNTYNFEVHFLITDKDKTYVVEFDNTKEDGEKLVIMEDESIMTNFYLHICDVENDVYSSNAMGIERYKKLKDNKENVKTMEDMKELMRSIRYTNSNRLDGEYNPGENFDNIYTCFSDHPISDEEPINASNYKEHLEEIMELMKKDGDEIKAVLNDPELKNPNMLWCTSHSSVYDLVNKKMTVAIFERFDKYYDYSFEK